MTGARAKIRDALHGGTIHRGDGQARSHGRVVDTAKDRGLNKDLAEPLRPQLPKYETEPVHGATGDQHHGRRDRGIVERILTVSDSSEQGLVTGGCFITRTRNVNNSSRNFSGGPLRNILDKIQPINVWILLRENEASLERRQNTAHRDRHDVLSERAC